MAWSHSPRTFTSKPQQSLSYPVANGQRLLENGFFILRLGDQKTPFRYAGATAPAGAGKAASGR